MLTHHNSLESFSPTIRQVKLPMASLFTEQWIRPITVDMSNSGIINQLEEATLGFTSITPSAIADIAPMIIKPKADCTGIAHIDNGWSQKRFIFYIEVEVSRSHYSSSYI